MKESSAWPPYITHEPCIRNAEGLICAWTVGMSEEAIQNFLSTYEGTYLDTEEVHW